MVPPHCHISYHAAVANENRGRVVRAYRSYTCIYTLEVPNVWTSGLRWCTVRCKL